MKRLFLLLPLLWSCSKSTKTEPPALTADSAPLPSASAPAPSATPAARALRPPEGTPTREEREAAALALLAGKKKAADLPLSDTDPGETFDPRLRKDLQASAQATLKIGPVNGEGIPGEAIQKAAQANRRVILRCYRAGLAQNPNLQGQLQAKIELTPTSKPSAVENAGSDIPDRSVIQCVLRVLKQTEFPAAEGKSATVTLHFAPGA